MHQGASLLFAGFCNILLRNQRESQEAKAPVIPVNLGPCSIGQDSPAHRPECACGGVGGCADYVDSGRQDGEVGGGGGAIDGDGCGHAAPLQVVDFDGDDGLRGGREHTVAVGQQRQGVGVGAEHLHAASADLEVGGAQVLVGAAALIVE